MKIGPDRDGRVLGRTKFCLHDYDGVIAILTDEGGVYEVWPQEVHDAAAFAETWGTLIKKTWFTPEVAFDFVEVVWPRWVKYDATF